MQEKVKAALKIVSRPRDEDEIEGYYGKDYDKAEVRKAYEKVDGSKNLRRVKSWKS